MCVWKNGKNMTLLVRLLYKYLNKSIGREETTLHRLDVSKKKNKNQQIIIKGFCNFSDYVCVGTL